MTPLAVPELSEGPQKSGRSGLHAGITKLTREIGELVDEVEQLLALISSFPTAILE